MFATGHLTVTKLPHHIILNMKHPSTISTILLDLKELGTPTAYFSFGYYKLSIQKMTISQEKIIVSVKLTAIFGASWRIGSTALTHTRLGNAHPPPASLLITLSELIVKIPL